MKESLFIILSISVIAIDVKNPYRQIQSKEYIHKCKVVNCNTHDTGTLYIKDGCLEIGDTVKLHEKQRRDTK